ncbi:MAG TPA: precorrin-8X methylmutase [Lachnospiraceae bacterium]|nr:precorrin-8X methylmutase [Lachnospiraceae bacterium]
MEKEKKYPEIEEIRPADIEKRSFEIIDGILKARGIILPEEEAPVTKRCIHTSADFDYADNLCYSEGVIKILKDAIRSGASIVTDTQMARSGINKKRLALCGGKVYCFMSDDDVAEEARKRGVTRAIVSMEKAAALDERCIFAIGNAPTALIELTKLIREGKIDPIAVIGVPVGFVNVTASKEMIMECGVPYIIARGNKGGSNIAACICNALLYNI